MDNTQPVAASQPTPAAALTPEQQSFVDKWSWGAFFGGLIWALGNKLYLWALLSLIPLVNIYVWIKLAMHGRRMAWAAGGWASFDQFKQRQKTMAWVIGGLMVLIVAPMVFLSTYAIIKFSSQTIQAQNSYNYDYEQTVTGSYDYEQQ